MTRPAGTCARTFNLVLAAALARIYDPLSQSALVGLHLVLSDVRKVGLQWLSFSSGEMFSSDAASSASGEGLNMAYLMYLVCTW